MVVRALGSWQLVALLGSGGMGTVYRGRHVGSGRLAALKTLTRPVAVDRRALRREIAALQELDHPGIVRLIEAAPDDRDPWYAMALLEGPTLRRVLGTPSRSPATWTESLVADAMWAPESSSEGPSLESLARFARFERFDDATLARLALVAQVAHALGRVHASGLVHCDVKPDNVLVTDGRAVLVDFGLVTRRGSRTDPATLIEGAGLAGTAAYMSPERGRGDPFDARADLYALGCMLYEVVTGQPPFVGAGVFELLEAHLFDEPEPLAGRVEGVPAPLEALVRDLLRKDPGARVGHVQRVLHVLGSVGVRVPEAPVPGPPPLYSPGLSGREGPLSALLGEADRALAGAGRVVWLLGEGGAGKSRLAAAFAARSEAASPLVLVGRCSALATGGVPAPSGVPLEAFAEPLRHAADLGCEDPRAARELARVGPVLRPFVPALGAVPGVQETPDAELLDGAQAGQARLHDAVFGALDAVAGGGRPLVLILDDLQWADELSVGTLGALLRRIGGRPWLVVGLVRSEADDTHLGSLLAQGTQLRLDRLSPAEVGQVVAEMLGDEVFREWAPTEAPEPLLGWVERHASGNPFFVGECLRAAVSEGFLSLAPDGTWQFSEPLDGALEAQPTPGSVEALVACRLAPLDPRARHVAEAAAVLGARSSVELLREVAGAEGLLEALDQLERRSIAQVDEGLEAPAPGPLGAGTPAPGPQVSFEHDRLVELVYASIEVEPRRELHQRAADVLERMGGDPARLGWHRERAAQPELARRAYGEAAAAAAQRYALGEAEQLLSEALRLVPDGDRLARARLFVRLAGEVWLSQGRVAPILASLPEAVADLEAGGAPPEEVATALLLLGRALIRSHDQGYTAVLERCRALAAEHGLAVIAARSTSELGAARTNRGDPAGAESMQREALALLPPGAPASVSASIRFRLANAVQLLARNDEALALLHQALGSLEGDDSAPPSAAAAAHGAIANILTALGRTEEALGHYEQALAIQRRLGNRRAEATVLNNLGAMHQRAGREEEGFALMRQALTVNHELGDRRMVGIGKRGMAMHAMGRGALEESEAMMAEARADLEAVGEVLWCAHVDQGLARVLRYLGRFAESEALLERATASYRALGVRVELGDAILQQVHLAMARGEDPRQRAGELEALAEELGAEPGSYLGVALAHARELVDAWCGGRAVVAGDLPESLSDALRRRLAT
jgi:serine/threonine protein kinase/tetratricopeptide (TPR) repeat protein